MAWDIRQSLGVRENADWLQAHADQVGEYRDWSVAWKPTAAEGETSH